MRGEAYHTHPAGRGGGYRPGVGLDPRQLDRLRQWRLGPQRELSLEGDIASLARQVTRQAEHLGGLSAAWGDLCPAAWRDQTQLVALSRGTLNVRARDASVRFQLDRWLRDGGELALIKRCPALLRVKVSG